MHAGLYSQKILFVVYCSGWRPDGWLAGWLERGVLVYSLHGSGIKNSTFTGVCKWVVKGIGCEGNGLTLEWSMGLGIPCEGRSLREVGVGRGKGVFVHRSP